jgi:hypothetical protein
VENEMALISCKTCDARVSVKAEKCPNCGEPDPSGRATKLARLKTLTAILIIVTGGCLLWFVIIPDLTHNGLFHNVSQRE